MRKSLSLAFWPTIRRALWCSDHTERERVRKRERERGRERKGGVGGRRFRCLGRSSKTIRHCSLPPSPFFSSCPYFSHSLSSFCMPTRARNWPDFNSTVTVVDSPVKVIDGPVTVQKNFYSFGLRPLWRGSFQKFSSDSRMDAGHFAADVHLWTWVWRQPLSCSVSHASYWSGAFYESRKFA